MPLDRHSGLTPKQRAVLQAASCPWPLTAGKIGKDAGIHGVENAQTHLRVLLRLGLVQREWKPAEHGMAAGYCYRTTNKGDHDIRVLLEVPDA